MTRRSAGDVAAIAVFAVFALSGLNFASWAARFPAVRDALDVTPGQFGLLLLIGAAGSIVALPLSGMVVERFGGRRTIAAFAVLHVFGLLLAGVGVALGEIAVVLPAVVLVGIGAGVWDAAMNFEAPPSSASWRGRSCRGSTPASRSAPWWAPGSGRSPPGSTCP